MARKKISELDDGGLFQADDAILIARAGQNYRMDGSQIADAMARIDALEDASDIPALPLGGSTGQVLAKSSEADGDATWIDPPTGGGGSSGVSLFPIKPPVVADFTVVAGRDFSTITAAPSFTSFRRNYNGDSGAQLGAFRGVPLTGETWEATAIIRIPVLFGSTTGVAGIAVHDTSGKLYEYGIEANSNNPQITLLRFNDNGVTYVNSGGSVAGMARLEWYAIRIRKTASFYYFEYSPDFGVTWVSHQGYGLTDHLGTADSVGIVSQTYGYSAPDSLVCAYWDLKYT